MPIRLCKIALVFASCFFLLLVVFNNITDYGSNFAFVSHVLSMDTTFPGNQGMWRAMTSPVVHHGFYATIILWEATAFVLTGLGTWRLWHGRRQSADAWQKAKTLAAVGLTISMLQWYVAFLCIGAEWFLMWQSKVWNGQDAAFRMFAMMSASLIFLVLRDEDEKADA
jgi:predicted small integral membrane protein